jgi:hypothetical protein
MAEPFRVRCEDCNYSRRALGGRIEAECKAVKHALKMRHKTVVYLDGEYKNYDKRRWQQPAVDFDEEYPF